MYKNYAIIYICCVCISVKQRNKKTNERTNKKAKQTNKQTQALGNNVNMVKFTKTEDSQFYIKSINA